MSKLPCRLFAVQVNKIRLREMGANIKNDTRLYRLAFERLLDSLDAFLKNSNENGMLLMDSRSTLRTSVQDDRLLRAYRDWLVSKEEPSSFVELPWFGDSQSYTGLQLADYVAYLLDRHSKEAGSASGSELPKAYDLLKDKIKLITIPE